MKFFFNQFEQTNLNEEISSRVVQQSVTCHNLTYHNDDQEVDESNKENKLFKNKSESDLVVNKNKLNKIYLPAEDTMDLEESFKESTGKKYSSSWFYGYDKSFLFYFMNQWIHRSKILIDFLFF